MDDNRAFYTSSIKKVGPFLPKNPILQRFAIPETIVYYISQKASSSLVYQKLFKTCKYFLRNQEFALAKNFADGKLAGDCIQKIDKRCLTKIWVIGIQLGLYIPNTFSKISSKLSYVDVKILILLDQKISYNDFLFLVQAGNVTTVNFSSGSTIKYKNGKWVELAEILEKLPLLQYFEYRHSKVSSINTLKSIQKIAETFYFPNLKWFAIDRNSAAKYEKYWKNFEKKHSFATFRES